MTMLKPRKAVSPLIASVLLIVVVLAIGAVVTGIARNYVTQSKQDIDKAKSDIECGTDVDITVPEVNQEYRVCKVSSTDPPSINITVVNTGTRRIDDMQIKIFGAKGFWTNDSVMPDGLGKGQTTTLGVEYDNSSIGTMTQINIVPRIKKAGQIEKLYCLPSQIVLSDLHECT